MWTDAAREAAAAARTLAQGHPKSDPVPVHYATTGPRYDAFMGRSVVGGAGPKKASGTSPGTAVAMDLRRRMNVGR
jgi:hypothetical protein